MVERKGWQERHQETCRDCIYRGYLGDGGPICEYILKTGCKRPCPMGAGCTVKQPERRARRVRTVSWDTQRAAQLLDEGLGDREVADMVGVPLTTLKSWKHRTGRTGRREEKTEPGPGEADTHTHTHTAGGVSRENRRSP